METACKWAFLVSFGLSTLWILSGDYNHSGTVVVTILIGVAFACVFMVKAKRKHGPDGFFSTLESGPAIAIGWFKSLLLIVGIWAMFSLPDWNVIVPLENQTVKEWGGALLTSYIVSSIAVLASADVIYKSVLLSKLMKRKNKNGY